MKLIQCNSLNVLSSLALSLSVGGLACSGDSQPESTEGTVVAEPLAGRTESAQQSERACRRLSDISQNVVVLNGRCAQVDQDLEITQASLRVENGATLKIAQGVTLRFGEGAELQVVGTRNAQAEVSSVESEGEAWTAIVLEKGSLARFEYARVSQGARSSSGEESSGLAAIEARSGSRLLVENSTIEQALHGALKVHEGAELLQFANNRMRSAGNVPVDLPASQAKRLDSETEFDGKFVKVRGGVLDDVTAWHALKVPYQVVDQDLVVESELTIEPGALVQFAKGLGLEVDGGFVEATDPEKVTAFYGVDVEPGSWKGIFLGEGASAILRGVTIDGAGAAAWFDGDDGSRAAIAVHETSQLTLTDSELKNSSGWGLHCYSGDAAIQRRNNLYINNAAGPLSLGGFVPPDVVVSEENEGEWVERAGAITSDAEQWGDEYWSDEDWSEDDWSEDEHWSESDQEYWSDDEWSDEEADYSDGDSWEDEWSDTASDEDEWSEDYEAWDD